MGLNLARLELGSAIVPAMFAVLYRTNAQSLPLQVQFILREIPYYVRDEDNLLGNELLSQLLALLRVRSALRASKRADPDDELDAIAAHFRYGLKAAEVDGARQLLARSKDFVRTLTLPSARRQKSPPSAADASLLPTRSV